MTSLSGNMGMRGGPTGSQQSGKVAGYKTGRMQNFTPEQMQLFQSMFSQVAPGSDLSRMASGDQSFYEQMEKSAMRQFGEMQAQNASRFSGMGMGARHGSGFQNSMNAATSNFVQDLASRRQALQRQALMDMTNMSSSLLGQRPYENFLVQPNEQPSFGQQVIGGALPILGAGAGAIAGSYFGNPVLGGSLGGQIGAQAGKAFF